MKGVLGKLSLGDDYEIQARVLPAMVIVIPAAILITQAGLSKSGWLEAIGWGTGLEVVVALLASKIGHALGVRLEQKLVRKWGGLPTHMWLLPSDRSHSKEQKRIWREAVSRISGLDIDKVIKRRSVAERDRVIADTVTACKNKIRGTEKAKLIRTYNITYAFARNLAGMKWLALTICLICSMVSLYSTLYCGFEVAGIIIQLLFLVIVGVYCFLADGYVRHCAVLYAEFFFAAVTDIAGSTRKRN